MIKSKQQLHYISVQYANFSTVTAGLIYHPNKSDV